MSELEMKVEALIRCVPKEVWRKALAEVSKGEPEKPHNLEDVIRDTLREIGMPNHILGFEYSLCAIRLMYEDPCYARMLVKGLYAKVAENCGTTASRAERAIRHGIESAWERYGSDLRDAYFNPTSNMKRDCPTTGEFICIMVDIVRQKMR